MNGSGRGAARLLRRGAAVGLAAVLAVGLVPAAQAAEYDGAAEATARNDFDDDGNADVIAARPNGELLLYRGDGASGWLGAPAVIGTGFYPQDHVFGMKDFTLAGDVDDDGRDDVLARDRDGSNLRVYRGNGRGGFLGFSIWVSTGWAKYEEVLPVDVDLDGYVDLYALDRDAGHLDFYRGRQGVSFAKAVRVATGVGNWENLMSPSDGNSDRSVELMFRDSTNGNLVSRPVHPTGALQRVSTTQIRGTGWGGMTAILGPGDFSGDGNADVLARNARGDLLLYLANTTGNMSRPKLAGTGWANLRLR